MNNYEFTAHTMENLARTFEMEGFTEAARAYATCAELLKAAIEYEKEANEK